MFSTNVGSIVTLRSARSVVSSGGHRVDLDRLSRTNFEDDVDDLGLAYFEGNPGQHRGRKPRSDSPDFVVARINGVAG